MRATKTFEFTKVNWQHILLVLPVLVLCIFALASQMRHKAQQRTFEARGAILPSQALQALFQQCAHLEPEKLEGFWMPSSNHIEELETRLEKTFDDYATASELPSKLTPMASYYRQYFGYTSGGKKMIYVNACVTPDVADWTRQPINSCGSKSPVMNAEFDVQSGEFVLFFTSEKVGSRG